jgi:predicted neuraminidase
MITPVVTRQFVAVDVPGRPQSHCSSLLVLGDGTVLVAWFAGDHEGAENVRIMLSRGSADGRFIAPTVLFTEAAVCHWNPVLAEVAGEVRLFFKRGPSIQTWVTWTSVSADAGRTWTDPVELVPGDRTGGRGPARHPPIGYAGRLVAPGSVEIWDEPVRWDCFVDVSDGAAWTRVEVGLDHAGMRGAGCIQPALWRTRDGQMAMLCRSTAGAAYRSATTDPFRWPALQPVALPNNNSGLAVVALPSGRLVCVHNPATEDWGARCPLVLSTSDDDGLTWTIGVVTIDDGQGPLPEPGGGFVRNPMGGLPVPDALRAGGTTGAPAGAAATGVVTTGSGEYSYPSLGIAGDELLISYTWQRRGIVLARVPIGLFG